MKRFASTIKKKRFTVKYPYGQVKRFGTCREEEDERFDIKEWVGLYFLCQYELDDIDYSKPEKSRELLPVGTLVANGYYAEENDDFVSPDVWLKQD